LLSSKVIIELKNRVCRLKNFIFGSESDLDESIEKQETCESNAPLILKTIDTVKIVLVAKSIMKAHNIDVAVFASEVPKINYHLA
jgi:hypothetical protein